VDNERKRFANQLHDDALQKLTAAELIDYCRERLAAYKCPRGIEFRDELPKSNVGKILRRQLREEIKRKAA